MLQLGMSIEGGLVYPFGVNVENQGIPQRFVEMNANAAGLGARRFEEQFQFFAELLLFPRNRFEANKSVQRQGSLPQSIAYVLLMRTPREILCCVIAAVAVAYRAAQ